MFGGAYNNRSVPRPWPPFAGATPLNPVYTHSASIPTSLLPSIRNARPRCRHHSSATQCSLWEALATPASVDIPDLTALVLPALNHTPTRTRAPALGSILNSINIPVFTQRSPLPQSDHGPPNSSHPPTSSLSDNIAARIRRFTRVSRQCPRKTPGS